MRLVRRARDIELTTTEGGSKRLRPGLFAGVLFPVVHLLFESPGFLLVYERQAGHTLLEFEGVEKGSVLVVLKGVVDFLIPDDASAGRRDIDQFKPKGVADQVVGKDYSPLKAGVSPSWPAWKCNVQLCDGDGLDLVGSFRHSALDGLLVSF